MAWKKSTPKVKAPRRKVAVKRRAPVRRAPVRRVMPVKPELKYATNIVLADSTSIRGTGLLYDGLSNLRGWSSGPSNGNGIIPAVVQGTGEADRIGNRIQPKSLTLSFNLYAMPTTDATTGALNTNPYKGVPFFVRIIVYRHKYAQDDYSQTNLMQTGNTAASFGSAIDNLFRPYNTDEYTILHSSTYKMASVRHLSGAGATTITTEQVPVGCKTLVHKKVKIRLPKILRYPDASSYPSNQGFFMAAAIVNEDGSADSSGTYIRCQLSAESSMSYYDV